MSGEKKRVIIVNNNMSVGGVQKALLNLLNEIKQHFELTLCLFSNTGAFLEDVPKDVKVVTVTGVYKYLGFSQSQCKNFFQQILRCVLVLLTRIFGRELVLKIMNMFQKKVKGEYDCAISYLHDGALKSFYGGCNEFVLKKIKAKKKISFLHCDFSNCGGNYIANLKRYAKFDIIAACSDGCKKEFLNYYGVDNGKNVITVENFQNAGEIRLLANEQSVIYEEEQINILTVARLSKEKGVERGIIAVKNAISRGIKNVVYHIVGDGIERKNLENLTKELGVERNVFFYGNQKNPYRFMKNADLLMIPSHHEAAPLVIGEARILALPVLTTLTTSSIDMVVDKEIGWACENSQIGINNKLLSLLKDKQSIYLKKNQLKEYDVDNSTSLQSFVRIVGA